MTSHIFTAYDNPTSTCVWQASRCSPLLWEVARQDVRKQDLIFLIHDFYLRASQSELSTLLHIMEAMFSKYSFHYKTPHLRNWVSVAPAAQPHWSNHVCCRPIPSLNKRIDSNCSRQISNKILILKIHHTLLIGRKRELPLVCHPVACWPSAFPGQDLIQVLRR